MDGNGIVLAAGLIAVALPVFLIPRFRSVGFVLSVLLGWGIVHITNLVLSGGPTAAMANGMWVVLGWVPLLIWSLMVSIGVGTFRSSERPQPPPRTANDPDPFPEK